ncbi:acyltransferase family protein, partial [Azospirillum brasilense]|nr:acyltransferase family protein [Azospirillum argentinense]
METEVHSTPTSSGTRLSALDGLRFFAFLLVFFSHMPENKETTILFGLHHYGWVGVEIFFVISAFLFFYRFNAEIHATGSINIKSFYTRRFLRIYPLLIAYLLMISTTYYSLLKNDALLRFFGIIMCIDNFIAWFRGYNLSIPYSGHLWSLSFEFQIYAIIPFAFMAFVHYGRKKFLVSILSIYLFCFLLRMIFTGAGATHPLVWVTPFLRPESVLIGVMLAAGYFSYIPHWALGLLAVAAGITFFSTPTPWADWHGASASYPLAAIMCGSLVGLSLKWNFFSNLLSWRPIRYLGSISYGLYILHFLGIGLAARAINLIGYDISVHISGYLYCVLFFTSLFITIAMATLSYYAIERPFLQLKVRFPVRARN